jgi:hypothetical protein
MDAATTHEEHSTENPTAATPKAQKGTGITPIAPMSTLFDNRQNRRNSLRDFASSRLRGLILSFYNVTMSDVNELAEMGSEQLFRMQYLDAIETLEQAEAIAWENRNWDLLSRLYMPLQEARRQCRQRCGEGTVKLDIFATSLGDPPDPKIVATQLPHGQVLVAGWGSIEPAVKLRQIIRERKLYLETFLAAVYPVGSGRAVVIVPTANVILPEPLPRSIDQLIALLPPHSIVKADREIPSGARPGSAETYAMTMDLWERLHAPFLAAADQTADPVQRIAAYRATIGVDYACELAHQKLSAVAHELSRNR